MSSRQVEFNYLVNVPHGPGWNGYGFADGSGFGDADGFGDGNGEGAGTNNGYGFGSGAHRDDHSVYWFDSNIAAICRVVL